MWFAQPIFNPLARSHTFRLALASPPSRVPQFSFFLLPFLHSNFSKSSLLFIILMPAVLVAHRVIMVLKY